METFIVSNASNDNQKNEYVTFITPNGNMIWPLIDIIDNRFLNGSLLQTSFTDTRFATKNSIFIRFNISTIQKLIPYIREGTIYASDIDCEFERFIDFIAGSNKYMSELLLQMKNGVMDEFGEKISTPFLTMVNYPCVMHYSENESNERRKQWIDITKQVLIKRLRKTNILHTEYVNLEKLVNLVQNGSIKSGINYTNYANHTWEAQWQCFASVVPQYQVLLQSIKEECKNLIVKNIQYKQ